MSPHLEWVLAKRRFSYSPGLVSKLWLNLKQTSDFPSGVSLWPHCSRSCALKGLYSQQNCLWRSLTFPNIIIFKVKHLLTLYRETFGLWQFNWSVTQWDLSSYFCFLGSDGDTLRNVCKEITFILHILEASRVLLLHGNPFPSSSLSWVLLFLQCLNASSFRKPSLIFPLHIALITTALNDSLSR